MSGPWDHLAVGCGPRPTQALDSRRRAELVVLRGQDQRRPITDTAVRHGLEVTWRVERGCDQHPPCHALVVDIGRDDGTEGVSHQPHVQMSVALRHMVQCRQHVEALCSTRVVTTSRATSPAEVETHCHATLRGDAAPQAVHHVVVTITAVHRMRVGDHRRHRG